MKYTITHAKKGDVRLKDVDEKTALAWLNITKRLLDEKIMNDELVRATWRVTVSADEEQGKDTEGDRQHVPPAGFTAAEWDRFKTKWGAACRKLGKKKHEQARRVMQ